MLNRRAVVAAATLAVAFVSFAPIGAQVARTPAPAASARNVAALNPASSPEALGFDAQRLAKLDTYMSKAVADGRVAGMITLLARHGQIVSEKAYGYRSLATSAPMTRDTIFR